VLRFDAEREQLLLGYPCHAVVALGREDGPVVGQKRSRIAEGLCGAMEHPDDSVAVTTCTPGRPHTTSSGRRSCSRPRPHDGRPVAS